MANVSTVCDHSLILSKALVEIDLDYQPPAHSYTFFHLTSKSPLPLLVLAFLFDYDYNNHSLYQSRFFP